MNVLVKTAAIAAASGLSFQPCLAAVAESQSTSVGVTMAASAAERVDFNLETHVSAKAGQKHAGGIALSTVADTPKSAGAAQDVGESKRRGMSKGAKTVLIVGGAVIVGVIALAVIAASSIPPGGDFDD